MSASSGQTKFTSGDLTVLGNLSAPGGVPGYGYRDVGVKNLKASGSVILASDNLATLTVSGPAYFDTGPGNFVSVASFIANGSSVGTLGAPYDTGLATTITIDSSAAITSGTFSGRIAATGQCVINLRGANTFATNPFQCIVSSPTTANTVLPLYYAPDPFGGVQFTVRNPSPGQLDYQFSFAIIQPQALLNLNALPLPAGTTVTTSFDPNPIPT